MAAASTRSCVRRTKTKLVASGVRPDAPFGARMVRDLEAGGGRERGEPVLGVPVQLPRTFEHVGHAIVGRLVAQDRGLEPRLFVIACLRDGAHPLDAAVLGDVLAGDAELVLRGRGRDEQRHERRAVWRRCSADPFERGAGGGVVGQQVERRVRRDRWPGSDGEGRAAPSTARRGRPSRPRASASARQRASMSADESTPSTSSPCSRSASMRIAAPAAELERGLAGRSTNRM